MDLRRTTTLNSLPQELIEAACKRDPEAWEELVERLNLILIRRLRLPPELARRFDDEDVLQVAFLRAWERIESFEYRGEGSFIAWIQQIVMNTLRDDIRYHARAMRDAAREERKHMTRIIPDRPNPDQQAALEEESLRLVAAVESLPVLEQRLIRLRLKDGRSWRDIAELTGHSRRTLRRALEDAMRRIASAVA